MDSVYLSIPDSILGKNEDGKFPQLFDTFFYVHFVERCISMNQLFLY